jgi:hypothetical protein
MSIRFDITKENEFFIGEDRTINIDVKQSDESTAQTMTGWSLTWELKPSPGEAFSIQKTTSDGITIGNGVGTDDRASITIGDGDTEAIEPGVYYHQLRRTDAGSEQLLSFGDVTLRESGL